MQGSLLGDLEPQAQAHADQTGKKAPRKAAPKPRKLTARENKQYLLMMLQHLETFKQREVVPLSAGNCIRAGLLQALDERIGELRAELRTCA